MPQATKEPRFHNRYIMYAADSDKELLRIDIITQPDGLIILKANGKRQPKPDAEFERLIKAEIEMQNAITAFIVKVNEKE